MFQAYKKFIRQALDSEGLATRSDYWFVFLVNGIIRAILLLFSYIFMTQDLMKQVNFDAINALDQIRAATKNLTLHPPLSLFIMNVIGVVFSLSIMIPVTTLTARRLRDAGLNPKLAYPLPAIYLVNALAVFISLASINFLQPLGVLYALYLLILATRRSRAPYSTLHTEETL